MVFHLVLILIPVGVIERCALMKSIVLHNLENSHSRERKELMVACREAKEARSVSGSE
jgi:hypothetical protein